VFLSSCTNCCRQCVIATIIWWVISLLCQGLNISHKPHPPFGAVYFSIQFRENSMKSLCRSAYINGQHCHRSQEALGWSTAAVVKGRTGTLCYVNRRMGRRSLCHLLLKRWWSFRVRLEDSVLFNWRKANPHAIIRLASICFYPSWRSTICLAVWGFRVIHRPLYGPN